MKSTFLFIGLILTIHYILPNPIFIRLENSIKTPLEINETEYYFFTEAKQNQFVNISYWNHSTTLECEYLITFYELKLDNEPKSYDISQSLFTYSDNFEYDDVEKHYWKRIEIKKNQTNYLGFKLSFLPNYNDTFIEIKVDSIGNNFYLENNTEFTLNNVQCKTPYFLYVKANNFYTINLKLKINNCSDNNPLLDDWVYWYIFNNATSESTGPISINVKENYIKKGNEFRFSFSHTLKENFNINYIAFKLITAYDISSIVATYNVKDINNQNKNDDNENSLEIFIKNNLKYIIIIGIVIVLIIILVIICNLRIKSKKKSIENEIYRTEDNKNPLLLE